MGQFDLRLFDRVLCVRVDHPEIEAYCRGAYAALLDPGSHCACADTGEIALASGRPRVLLNGHELALDERAHATPFHAAVYGSSVLLQHWFTLHRAYSSWYASGVRIGGGAVILSAPSGTGKTTLTLELLRRGHGFYGDEFVFVRKEDGMVFPFLRSLLIREGTRRMFEHDVRLQHACERTQHRDGPGTRSWHFVHAQDVFGPQVTAGPAPLRAAIVLERGERTLLEPLAPSVLALNVALRIGQRARGFDRLWAILQVLGGVACYRLVVGDIGNAADRIDRLAAVAA